jgi:hypothetical protein
MALNRGRIVWRSMSIQRKISIKHMKSIGFLTPVGPDGKPSRACETPTIQ